MAYVLDRDELVLHLQEQVEFLQLSARAFDDGMEAEAKRLALTLRVLLHQTPRSQSVLDQLGVKERLYFVDTAAKIHPSNLASTPGLLVLEMKNDSAGYRAPLGELSPPRCGQFKPFEMWWTSPVTKDQRGVEFSRKDYVLGLANKEGGGHVDPRLNERYAHLTKHNSLGWTYGGEDDVQLPFESPAPPSVRQITYKVLETI